MSIGYFGYAKLADVFLLTKDGGLNRKIDPIMSEAVWGAGWLNGAQYTNYADNQQHFEGSLTFELQGIASVWDLVRDWMIYRRVDPKDLIVSPNGLVVQSYLSDVADPRKGAWLNSAAFTLDPNQAISLNCSVKALMRDEDSSASQTYRDIDIGPGIPTAPLNPSPYNRNPFPGWSAIAEIVWPGAPAYFTDAAPSGMFLKSASWTFNNNTQIIGGCTGLPNPAAVMQGVMAVEGSLVLFRDGVIPDPYANPTTPFTASGAHVNLSFGTVTPVPTVTFPFVLLKEDDFVIKGQNDPVTRTFGFAGLGDGTGPPMAMGQLGTPPGP